MTPGNKISIYDFVKAISEAVGPGSQALNSHHEKVTYISWRIAREMNLPEDEIQDVVLAAMLHDICDFPFEDQLIKAVAFDADDPAFGDHALQGYNILKGFEPLTKAAILVRRHHSDYDPSRWDIPLGSYIIYLADTVAVLLNSHQEILAQAKEIFARVNRRKHVFHPGALAAFNSLADQVLFWIEAGSPPLDTFVLKQLEFPMEILNMETFHKTAVLEYTIVV
uniref:Metal dependent phosphohydrolase n=1 Tax=uncultured bacterium contig00036 TaxID=1181524 RepID=A0A806K0E1_9BACT|nr:metal dependent phosphohydrolase [uncultured bacterium contig00036]